MPGEIAWGDLLSQIAGGNENSLAILYDSTHRTIYGLALRVLANSEDAEEVTLDVYNQVWRSAKTFEPGRGTVMAWLLTLARTRALDKLRARASRQKNVDRSGVPFDMPSATATPEEQSASSQQRAIVKSALQKLPVEQRQALELAFFHGLSHAELAERLGEPLGTVKTRIRLGMMKLKDHLVIGFNLGHQEAGT